MRFIFDNTSIKFIAGIIMGLAIFVILINYVAEVNEDAAVSGDYDFAHMPDDGEEIDLREEEETSSAGGWDIGEYIQYGFDRLVSGLKYVFGATVGNIYEIAVTRIPVLGSVTSAISTFGSYLVSAHPIVQGMFGGVMVIFTIIVMRCVELSI